MILTEVCQRVQCLSRDHRDEFRLTDVLNGYPRRDLSWGPYFSSPRHTAVGRKDCDHVVQTHGDLSVPAAHYTCPLLELYFPEIDLALAREGSR